MSRGKRESKKKRPKTTAAAKTDDDYWRPNLGDSSGDEKKSKRKKKKSTADEGDPQSWLKDDDEKSVASQTRSKKLKRAEERLAQPGVLTYPTPNEKKNLKSIEEEEESENDGENSSSSDSSTSDSNDESTVIVETLAATAKKAPQPKTSGLWGVAKVLNSMNTPEDQHTMAKIASGHSTTDFLNLVITADDLLAFGIMFTGPYVNVLHSCAMFNNVRDPKLTETGIWGFLGAGDEISAPPPCAVPKSWLTTKSNKLSLKKDTPIAEQMAADPTQLWNGYEGMDANKKELKDSPPIVLLFPDLAAHLLPGDKTPLHALIWLDDFIQAKKLDKADFQVYYNYFELAACTKKSAGPDSLMAMPCKSNLMPSKKFCSWRKKRLKGVEP